MASIISRAFKVIIATTRTSSPPREAETLVKDFGERLQFLYDLLESRPFQIDFLNRPGFPGGSYV